ncbi:hypothetical protein EYF80_053936 [Liparis tanakae]|uniref:Uncharacterized protein n=1 Tax=Liparis tanakae TaxID=230148 RepID=A0A4Z2F581_9TELE|nr:hypothetical protein EYF80_053936 [Liparis tanakae]
MRRVWFNCETTSVIGRPSLSSNAECQEDGEWPAAQTRRPLCGPPTRRVVPLLAAPGRLAIGPLVADRPAACRILLSSSSAVRVVAVAVSPVLVLQILTSGGIYSTLWFFSLLVSPGVNLPPVGLCKASAVEFCKHAVNHRSQKRLGMLMCPLSVGQSSDLGLGGSLHGGQCRPAN